MILPHTYYGHRLWHIRLTITEQRASETLSIAIKCFKIIKIVSSLLLLIFFIHAALVTLLCTLYMLDVVIIMPHTHARVAPQAGHSALCGVGLVLQM